MTCDTTVSTFFPHCCRRGCWRFPPHQKHCHKYIVLVVLLTCSWCVFRFWLFSLADSRTWLPQIFWRWLVLCLYLFPINFTRRASDVKLAINWSLLICSEKSWYSLFLGWGFYSKARPHLERASVFSTCINYMQWSTRKQNSNVTSWHPVHSFLLWDLILGSRCFLGQFISREVTYEPLLCSNGERFAYYRY